MKARSVMSHRIGVSGLGLLSVLALFAPRPAHAAEPAADKAAADDDEEEEEGGDAAPAKAEATAKPEAAADTKEAAKTEVSAAPAADDGGTVIQPDDQSEQMNGFVRPESTSTLQWHGSLETDATYAGYSDQDIDPSQGFYDMRGRFVVGPTVEYRFGEGKTWFVAARGEMVAWLRERTNYQINADDVYGQVGKKGLWDLKLGRFQAWRVYHKGFGFDLYTIEDQGACTSLSTSCSLESGSFGPHTYEVNYNYYREPAGKAAVHIYPTPWAGIELLGLMGNSDGPNQLGGRAAALVHFPYVRASAAVEYRATRPPKENDAACPKCGNVADSIGFGGGVELTIKPVAIGVNGAQGKDTKYNVTTGVLDNDASATRTSLGGYAEFDVGSLAFERSLILGFGLNRTEVVDKVDNFEQHYQSAAYALFPLGFNAASIKLVVSQSTMDIQKANGDGTATALPQTKMQAARIRFTYPF
ncbi:MAG: hypothetical protein ABUL60_09120 [Myxococcales bacterium]